MMANGYTQPWTDERTERLKTLWADGLSAGQISYDLGGTTRNAVIGKVYRLGLEKRRGALAYPQHMEKARHGIARQRAAKALLRAPRFVLDEERFEKDIAEPIISNPVSLLGLQEHHCRWVLGEPAAMLFCGNQKAKGLVYCAGHARMAYRVPPPRRVQAEWTPAAPGHASRMTPQQAPAGG